jgi:hypothetical protein
LLITNFRTTFVFTPNHENDFILLQLGFGGGLIENEQRKAFSF